MFTIFVHNKLYRTLKRLLILICFGLFVLGASAQQFYNSDGSLKGRVDNSRIYDARGRFRGRVDGTQLYNGSGSFVGRIDNGRVYDYRGGLLGRIDGDRVYNARGSLIGRADGLDTTMLALIYFFPLW